MGCYAIKFKSPSSVFLSRSLLFPLPHVNLIQLKDASLPFQRTFHFYSKILWFQSTSSWLECFVCLLELMWPITQASFFKLTENFALCCITHLSVSAAYSDERCLNQRQQNANRTALLITQLCSRYLQSIHRPFCCDISINTSEGIAPWSRRHTYRLNNALFTYMKGISGEYGNLKCLQTNQM